MEYTMDQRKAKYWGHPMVCYMKVIIIHMLIGNMFMILLYKILGLYLYLFTIFWFKLNILVHVYREIYSGPFDCKFDLSHEMFASKNKIKIVWT